MCYAHEYYIVCWRPPGQLKRAPPQKAVPNIFTGAGMGAKKLNPYHGISQGWLILLIQHIDQHIDNRPL